MVQNEQEAKWPGRIADASSTLGDNSCAEHYWVSFELSEPRSVDGDSDRQTENARISRGRRVLDWLRLPFQGDRFSPWLRGVTVLADAIFL